MFRVISVSVLALALYLCFWPVSVQPIAWQAPQNPGYQGVFEQNQKLAELEYLSIDQEHGPEDLDMDANGAIYASVHSGWILRMAPQDKGFTRWVNTKGRPLGMDFDSAGNLVVADAYKGLLSIAPDKSISVLTDQIGNSPILYADDVDIAADGKIYFSDASVRFGAEANGGTYEASLLDVMEHSRSGRVLVYDPNSKSTELLMDGLSFANGIAMDPASQFILISETSEYRIHKYWIAGDKQGEREILIDNLPGFPDNIVTGQDGRFWLGLVSPRVHIVDALADKPWLRKIIQRFPAFLRPAAQPYGHVVAISADGEVQISMQDASGQYPVTTGVLETDDYLYISSLMAPVAARMPKDDELLAHKSPAQ